MNQRLLPLQFDLSLPPSILRWTFILSAMNTGVTLEKAVAKSTVFIVLKLIKQPDTSYEFKIS